ncbi:4-alpha-glucanotransferase [Elusimicrobium simillimum]|uniref:4-alpha-glucanotransferase n=1 Tax=Elusimicrobium simillimum TaxID=3143438 RepID=UPI003C6ECB19
MTQILDKKSAGVLMPMFAMRSTRDWGVGDFSSLQNWVNYFASTGTGVVQILPINEMAPGQNCPYNALTSFAIDPVYIAVHEVEDVQNCQAAQDFIISIQPLIDLWHKSDRVFYVTIRDAKLKTLWQAFNYFLKEHVQKNTPRAEKFKNYQERSAHWLDNYALFRALKDYFKWQTWTQWPDGLKNREPQAIKEFTDKYTVNILFYKYMQWICDEQIKTVTQLSAQNNVKIFGDIPFGINLDSADVWAERDNFNPALEVGAPPDQFSTEGQRWGLPEYDWVKMYENNFNYWRRKVTRACELYDIFRLDHLVGFFRTFVYDSPESRGFFDWIGDDAQRKRGHDFLTIVKSLSNNKQPVGEDLGVIPNFTREVMTELQIPGYKIMRWEREDDGYYREPKNYPQISVAALSTHDTETLRDWWETMPLEERSNIWEMISTQKTNGLVPFTPEVQEIVLRRILNSGSAIVMLSVQDIAGTVDRINVPGLVSEQNWSFRFKSTPETIEQDYPAEMSVYKRLLLETNRSTNPLNNQ